MSTTFFAKSNACHHNGPAVYTGIEQPNDEPTVEEPKSPVVQPPQSCSFKLSKST